MEISEIEKNIYEAYGLSTEALYENLNGREKLLFTSIRYVFWYILHTEYKWKGKRIAETFNRKPRIVWRGLSLTKFRLEHDQFFIDIYNTLRKGAAD